MNDWADEWVDDDGWKDKEEKTVNVKCTDADCENDLHCFLMNQTLIKEGKEGLCRYCGVDLIDWKRLSRHELDDKDYLFTALKNEFIRHHMWHIEIDQKAINHARRKGKIKLEEAVKHRLENSIKPLPNQYDGRQTPFKDNIIYYAQHATASCCRKCMAQWHSIPRERELTNAEVNYFRDIIMEYINERMPHLTLNGEKVPPIKK